MTKRFAGLAGGALLALVLLLAGRQTGTVGPSPTAKERQFEFTYRVSVKEIPAGMKKLRLWIPAPQPDAHQEIAGLKIDSPVAYVLHREEEYGNRLIYLEIDPRETAAPFEVTLKFRVRRRENKVAGENAGWLARAFSDSGSGEWTAAANLERNLQADKLVPLDGVIAALAAQEVDPNAAPLVKARQVYDYVVSTIRYDKSGEGWGRGDAVFACDSKRGNCTDFHSVFIGLLRASGVPARFEIGFSLPPDKGESGIPSYHCWASFYVEGLGWVPVDASEAWKHPEKREYFFGTHDENRVLFTLGRDLRLAPAQVGEPLNYFIYPYAEADGKPVEVEQSFSFRDADADR